MGCDILFERDFLYPTEVKNEPGSIHIQVFAPDNNSKIPVVVEPKTAHSPLKYIDTIIRIMQSDIFDRIFIDIKKNVDIYIKTSAETSEELKAFTHVKVYHSEDGFFYEGINR